MKIAVNTRLLLNDKLEGIGWFEYHILQNWVRQHPEHQFYFIFDRPYGESFIFDDNVTPIVAYPPARHPMLWYIWYEWTIPRVLKKIQADIFVSLDAYTSLRAQIPKITGIHDIAFAHFDHQMDSLSQWYMRRYTPKYIQSSDIILTVSQATQSDLINLYHTGPSKIVITHNAPSAVYRPLSDEEKLDFKSEKTEGQDFFLFVGAIHPRKNVLKLLEAFEQFKQQYQTSHKLVLIGRMAWQYNRELTYLETMNYRSDVIRIPHSDPKAIAEWMGAATALILISHYEGFGVPLVEAMACHTPIICSNISSMPEISGNAAIHVDPNNTHEISEAMYHISTDMTLRDRLIQAAQSQISKYTWESAADIAWGAVERLLGSK